jgi:hypothetical protein
MQATITFRRPVTIGTYAAKAAFGDAVECPMDNEWKMTVKFVIMADTTSEEVAPYKLYVPYANVDGVVFEPSPRPR